MKTLIENYPLFSYITVPLLLIVLIFLTFVLLRPRNMLEDNFIRLYNTVLQSLDDISAYNTNPTRDALPILYKKILRTKYYYEMLESEELYEVEGIISNIEKAASICKALLVSKAGDEKVSRFMPLIKSELIKIQETLYGFGLTRERKEPLTLLHTKRGKKRAQEYLRSLEKKD